MKTIRMTTNVDGILTERQKKVIRKRRLRNKLRRFLKPKILWEGYDV